MAVGVARHASLLPVLREGLPGPRGWLVRRGTLLALLLVAVLVPIPNFTYFQTRWISFGLIFVMIGLSVNQVVGYLGQVSLGHHAFVGIGAFTSALLVTQHGLSFWIAIVVAAGTGALAAMVLGFVALRLKGLVLALITFAYGEIATNSLFNIKGLTGGGGGVEAPRPPGFTGELAFVYLTMLIVGVLWFVDWRLTRSKAGRAISAIRENEIAAASFGVNVVRYKLLAFVMSGAFAGIAGAFFAAHTGFVVAGDFNFRIALTWVLMVVVGGLGSRPGVLIGSMFFALLASAFSSPTATQVIQIAGALLLLMTLTMFPGGIAQQIRPFTDWFAGRPFSFRHKETTIQSGGGGVRP